MGRGVMAKKREGDRGAFGRTHRRPIGPQASHTGPSEALLERGTQVSLRTLLPRHRQADTHRGWHVSKPEQGPSGRGMKSALEMAKTPPALRSGQQRL